MDLDGDSDEEPPRKRQRRESSSASNRQSVKDKVEGHDEMDLLGSRGASRSPSRENEAGATVLQPTSATGGTDVAGFPPPAYPSTPRKTEDTHSRFGSSTTRLPMSATPTSSPRKPVQHTPLPSRSAYSIPMPAVSAEDDSAFAFPTEPDDTNDVSPQRVSITSQQPAYRPTYTLPPLKSLPAEYNKKVKKGKGKRDKDKEKGSDKDSKNGKDDFAPIGANKWGAMIRANPVWTRVSRASKCVSSREWNVRVRTCCGDLYWLMPVHRWL
jgi:hypothetical protein